MAIIPNCYLSEITELKYTSLKKKIIIKEENIKWHLEAFASELFIYIYIYIYIYIHITKQTGPYDVKSLARHQILPKI